MSEFWYTLYTMQDLYGKDYESFSLFGRVHLFWLVLSVFIWILGAFLYHRASEKRRRTWRAVLGTLLVLLECSRQLTNVVTGQWEPAVMPLHLCSINIFVCAWYSIHPTKLAGNILYALCLPAAIIALLSPSWLALPITNFFHISSELLHILLALYPVLLLAGGFRPDIHELPKVLSCLLGVCVIIYPLNKVLDTNFMFLNDPYGNIITVACTAVFGERFYLIGFAVILFLLMLILYLPWWISGRKISS
ncbi:MAG: YwaF family protein [Lachnospiraceae bacterium]|nr:YwaF family protein [Lachnospiraceae bacterium]